MPLTVKKCPVVIVLDVKVTPAPGVKFTLDALLGTLMINENGSLLAVVEKFCPVRSKLSVAFGFAAVTGTKFWFSGTRVKLLVP